eukprot:TRINITY_DN22441_c0_g1_i1.p1 TRINITY_DN22441_c0_g1~~TRINITY_DN22441_c0_g1_i1.p1  ORF type:complete len:497 (-),score=61.06 TRINITY_DN22441_c0_g1_i1:131-1621(-)
MGLLPVTQLGFASIPLTRLILDITSDQMHFLFQEHFGIPAVKELNRSRGHVAEVGAVCDTDVHGLTARICYLGPGAGISHCPGPICPCDELMKFTLPRTYVRLAVDTSMDSISKIDPVTKKHADTLGRFGERRVSGGACDWLGYMYCPSSTPIAVSVVKRCGSRSAQHWVILLEEKLLEGLEHFRTRMLNSLPAVVNCDIGGGCRKVAVNPHPSSGDRAEKVWLDLKKALMIEEAKWVGCLEEGGAPTNGRHSLQHSLFQASRFLHQGIAPAFLPQSLTCCRTGASRLRVLVVRHPFARVWSMFEMAKRRYTGAVEFGIFDQWVGRLLELWPESWTCKRRRSAVGCAGIPACAEPPGCDEPPWGSADVGEVGQLEYIWTGLVPVSEAVLATGHLPSDFILLRLEDVPGSMRRIEKALCEQFAYCPPEGLPAFPAADVHTRTASGSWDDVRCLGTGDWPKWLVGGLQLRYRSDFHHFGYTLPWIPSFCNASSASTRT